MPSQPSSPHSLPSQSGVQTPHRPTSQSSQPVSSSHSGGQTEHVPWVQVGASDGQTPQTPPQPSLPHSRISRTDQCELQSGWQTSGPSMSPAPSMGPSVSTAPLASATSPTATSATSPVPGVSSILTLLVPHDSTASRPRSAMQAIPNLAMVASPSAPTPSILGSACQLRKGESPLSFTWPFRWTFPRWSPSRRQILRGGAQGALRFAAPDPGYRQRPCPGMCHCARQAASSSAQSPASASAVQLLAIFGPHSFIRHFNSSRNATRASEPASSTQGDIRSLIQ